jgi:hypothetical protein
MPASKSSIARRYKRDHHRLRGLDRVAAAILGEFEDARVVPGPIMRTRAVVGDELRVQRRTPAGWRCLYRHGGAAQEVFVITSAPDAVRAWIEAHATAP